MKAALNFPTCSHSEKAVIQIVPLSGIQHAPRTPCPRMPWNPAMPEDALEPMPEDTLEPWNPCLRTPARGRPGTLESMPEDALEPMPKDALEPMPKDALEPMPKDALEPMPKDALEPMPKDALEPWNPCPWIHTFLVLGLGDSTTSSELLLRASFFSNSLAFSLKSSRMSGYSSKVLSKSFLLSMNRLEKLMERTLAVRLLPAPTSRRLQGGHVVAVTGRKKTLV